MRCLTITHLMGSGGNPSCASKNPNRLVPQHFTNDLNTTLTIALVFVADGLPTPTAGTWSALVVKNQLSNRSGDLLVRRIGLFVKAARRTPKNVIWAASALVNASSAPIAGALIKIPGRHRQEKASVV